MTIPVQLDQVLTLALGVVFVTQALKAAASQIGGRGAIVVSAIVSALLTLLAYAAGWVPVSIPDCSALGPFACVGGWVSTAGAALALANLLYEVVYARVFAKGPA